MTTSRLGPRLILELSTFLIVASAFATLPAWGDVIVNQQGATNPASNGFATDLGVTSQGPSGSTVWNVQGFLVLRLRLLHTEQQPGHRLNHGW